MGRPRTASVEVDRVDISDGDWIELKRELSARDERWIADQSRPTFWQENGEGRVTANLYQQRVATVVAYLTDWSCCGADGKRLPVGEEGVLALSGSDLEEIHKAVTDHADRVEKEKNAKKAGAIDSEPNSSPAA